MATLYDVKAAIRDLLANELPDDVSVFYGWKEADAPGRFAVVCGGETDYTNERLMNANSLARYDLTYNVSVDCASGLMMRTEEDAEKQCLSLLEAVLDLLVRPAEPLTRIGQVWEVVAKTDEFIVRLSDSGQPQFSVLRLTLAVSLTRE